MKIFPVEKYKFDIQDRQVVASSTYKGETVAAKAVCHPQDEFDPETGKKLAAARCGYKIALKRRAHARKAWVKAQDDFEQAMYAYRKAKEYLTDSEREVVLMNAEVCRLESKL